MFYSDFDEYLTEDEKIEITKIKKALIFRMNERDAARKEEFDDGVRVEQIHLTRRMLQKGLDIKVIAEISEFSEKEVKRIEKDQ